ncbi:MAG: hypothetical protein R3246_15770, partial [Acidimicrobiia bacterium]|nr:hypothetical protein [Acidimicrobiia bacterium]
MDSLRPAFERHQPIEARRGNGLLLDRLLRVFENDGALGRTTDARGGPGRDDPEALVALALAAAW